MITLPEIHLPDDFLYILKQNIHFEAKNIYKFTNLILSKSDLSFFIRKYFKDIDPQKRIEVIIKSMGWENFRNQLGAIYLHKVKFGKYPETIRNINPDKILEDDLKRLSSFCVQGFSRAYLLLFYMDCVRSEYFKQNNEDLNFYITDNVYKILKHTSARVVDIDWLVLQLLHFLEFFEYDHLERLIVKERKGFSEIALAMDERLRTKMFSNLLAYSYSINNIEMIVPSFVM